MSNESTPQYARVEQPFGCGVPIVHCPICGNPTIEAGVGATPCPHLAFIYVHEVSSFEYKSEDFEARTSKIDLEEPDSDAFEQLLAEAGYGNSMLVIELTYGGMACGPVWATVIVGFDYNSLHRGE